MEVVYAGIGAIIFSIYLVIDTQVSIIYVREEEQSLIFEIQWSDDDGR